MKLVLEFHRSQEADEPFAFRGGRQQYVRRTAGGGAETATLDWDAELVKDLSSVRRPGCDPATVQRLGDRMQRFLAQTEWPRDAAALAAAVERGEPVRITLRLSAAELYALPWELLTFKASGEPIGTLSGVLFHYEWPDTRTAPEQPSPRPEGGRILFAWSAAGGGVPAAEHQTALIKACTTGYHPFDPERDILSGVSIEQLLNKLEEAAAAQPISVLHILSHGAKRGATFGLAWDGTVPGEVDVIDGDRLRRVLSPHAARLRLVVLCACDSANAGELGNHLGSLAQALHRVGIQAVVASRFPLSVAGSERLTEALYGELLGKPASLESSLGAARRTLLSLAGLDWASVQLYLRSADGEDTRPIVLRPYRGLLAFEPQHQHFFFGRDEEEKEIRGDLNALIAAGKPRLLVVAGASGTGKSSLVIACAVPRLLKELGARWLAVRMRPGSAPLEALEQALATAREAGVDANKPLLLIVDQFEELFTHGTEPPSRQAFARQLWALAKDPASRASVILTLRVDFIGQCGELTLDDSGLSLDRVAYDEAHRVFVARLRREQLRAAIEEPARRAGLRLEEGLVSRMLEDVGTEPGALPLLEYALDLLWEQRQGPTLTQAAYDAVGGVTGALHGRADKLLDELDAAEQRAARRLLVRLVSVGDDVTLGTRRRVPISKLRPPAPDDAARFDRALALLIDARLLVRDAEKGQPVMIEVAHEALIRKWSCLAEWVRADRQMLTDLEKVESWVAQWKDLGTLLSGNQLGYAAELEKRYREDFPADAQALLTASQARAEEERRRMQKARRRTQLVAAIFAVATVVLGGLGAWAWQERQRGQQRLIQIYEEQGLRELQRGEDLRAFVYLSKAYSETKKPDVALLTALLQATKSAEAQLISLEGHQADVNSAAFNADGTRVVTASGDKTAKLWDAHSGKELLTLQSHQGSVQCAAFSADGIRVVTASRDKTAKLWDAHSGKELLTLQGHQDAVQSAAFSADGIRVVTASRDKTAKLWDAHSGKELLTLQGHQDAVQSAAFSADGTRVVTASSDKTAKLWDALSGKELLTLQGHQSEVNSAVFNADGTHVVTASLDKTAKLWNTLSGKELLTLQGHRGWVSSAVFSADGTRVVTASSDKTAKLWDALRGTELLTLQGHQSGVQSVAFSVDGTLVVTASRDKTAKLWDALRSKKLLILQGHLLGVLSAAFNTDSTRVVTASWDETAKIWDALNGKELLTLRGHHGWVYSAAFSTDGTRVVTASRDKTAKLWDAHSGKELLTLQGHQNDVLSAAFSADGTRVVTASRDKTAKLWDVHSGKELLTLQGHQSDVNSAVFNADGTRVVTASRDTTAKLWDAHSGKELLTLQGHYESVQSTAFSADGTRVVTASVDQTAKIWDVHSGKELFTLQGHHGSVLSAAFSADGTRLVTASVDQTAKIWDAHSGKELLTIGDHDVSVESAAFSSDGTRVVTASYDAARVWDVAMRSRPRDQIAALVHCRAIFQLDEEGRLQAARPRTQDCPPGKPVESLSHKFVSIHNLRASAWAAAQASNLKLARAYGQQALELSQKQGWQEEDAETRLLFSELARLDADLREAHSQLGKARDLFLAIYQPKKAFGALRRLASIEFRSLRDPTAALVYYDQAHKLLPDNSSILADRAEAEFAAGKLDTFLQDLPAAMNAEKGPVVRVALSAYAWAAVLLGGHGDLNQRAGDFLKEYSSWPDVQPKGWNFHFVRYALAQMQRPHPDIERVLAVIDLLEQPRTAEIYKAMTRLVQMRPPLHKSHPEQRKTG